MKKINNPDIVSHMYSGTNCEFGSRIICTLLYTVPYFNPRLTAYLSLSSSLWS